MEKFKYELIIFIKSTHRYIEVVEEAESIRPVIFNLIMKDGRKLVKEHLTIYVRRQSGDLKFMGSYDGTCSVGDGFRSYHILSLSNGMRYSLSDEGFELY